MLPGTKRIASGGKIEESGGDVDYAAFAENHRFQIPAGVHWNDVREKPENVGLTLEKVVFEPLEQSTVVRWGMMTR